MGAVEGRSNLLQSVRRRRVCPAARHYQLRLVLRTASRCLLPGRRLTYTNHHGEVAPMSRATFLSPRGPSTMCSIHTGSGVVTYQAIRKAMNGEPYTMSLTGRDEIRAVIEVVNEGIDSHLEACFCPENGDSYEGGSRKAGKLMLCRTLECCISIESTYGS